MTTAQLGSNLTCGTLTARSKPISSGSEPVWLEPRPYPRCQLAPQRHSPFPERVLISTRDSFLPNGQLKSTQHDTCLGISSSLDGLSSRGGLKAVVMEPCASGTARWKLDTASGALSLSSTAAGTLADLQCLTVVTGAATGSFVAAADGDHFFYLDMCHGFVSKDSNRAHEASTRQRFGEGMGV